METRPHVQPVILLIIEDWHSRALIHAQLDEEGFDARSSPTWTLALAVLDRQSLPRLSAVIVDVWHDAADGDLARRLARLAGYAPIVALTGTFGPKPEALLRMGAQSVLRRPFTVGEVSRALQALLSAQPVTSGLA